MPKRKGRKAWAIVAIGVSLSALLFAGYLWAEKKSSEPRQAPEAEQVLQAQTGLPFQVLIPAYLPASFNRTKMEIRPGLTDPQGQAMIQLVYPARQGVTLTINEWLAPNQGSGKLAASNRRCICICVSPTECNMIGAEVTVGTVRIGIRFSTANALSSQQTQLILDTLGPAANLQIYSSAAEVPLSYSVPPAVEVPLNSSGVQELTLVVTPQGYSPVHFSVKKGVPVRLIFRQLGYVGCGNEMIFEYEAGKSTTLTLGSPNDKQVFEFTPGQAGDFSFHCPHLIYRGVMTVQG